MLIKSDTPTCTSVWVEGSIACSLKVHVYTNVAVAYTTKVQPELHAERRGHPWSLQYTLFYFPLPSGTGFPSLCDSFRLGFCMKHCQSPSVILLIYYHSFLEPILLCHGVLYMYMWLNFDKVYLIVHSFSGILLHSHTCKCVSK